MIHQRQGRGARAWILPTCVLVWWLMSVSRMRGPDRERGDVPGWVMITVMTAALVLAILIPFREAIVTAIQDALDSVTSQ
ncbi:MAG: hypothetical protein M3313_15605 [Actinomycetota bacterium]|nr:hypothetical protein [Actinomycetota bacterium]